MVHSMYVPFVQQCVRFYKDVINEAKMEEKRCVCLARPCAQPHTRSEWLVCFMAILRYAQADNLRQYLCFETKANLLVFCDLLTLALDCFKEHKGDRTLLNEFALITIDNIEYMVEDFQGELNDRCAPTYSFPFIDYLSHVLSMDGLF